MGRVNKKVRARLGKIGLSGLATGDATRRLGLPDLEELIIHGLDPVHAAYAFIQNITSIFAEGVSLLLEMKKYSQIVGKAEDEYIPEAPPISPLTTSYFTCWAFFDLRFDDGDTLASCLIESSDVLGMSPDQLDAAKKMAASRMGIYQHVGMDGEHVRLQELVTNANYHIVFTTPYILMASKDDWLQFLDRTLLGSGKDGKGKGLHHFLKYGPDHNYWNEFNFEAYHHHQSDAIFLTGIPDLKATLPHA